MKGLVAHRAVFGERQNAHDLLAVSGQRDLFRRFSAIEVDLPADDSTSSKWEPFLRGWQSDDHYYFARTAPDLTAKRPGMVRTQILAFCAAEVPYITDLNPLFDDLENPWNLEQIEPFALPVADLGPTSINQIVAAEVMAAAEIVAGGVAGTVPGVFVSQAGFKQILVDLWHHLKPEFRSDLAFGFSFSPADLYHRKLHLACAPAALADRWRTYSRRIVVGSSKTPSDAAAFLLGLAKAGIIRDFIASANLPSPNLENLSLFARLSNYWMSRASLALSGWIAMAKDILLVAPSDTESEAIKNEIVDQLTRLMPAAEVGDILSLRNLRTEPFGAAGERLASSIRNWISKCSNQSASTGHELLEVFRAWRRPASDLWTKSVRAGLAMALEKPTNDLAANIWFLWQQDASLFTPIHELIPATAEAERIWVATTPPQLLSPLSAALIPWCRARNWWLEQAQVLLASKSWADAIAEHFSADNQLERIEPVRLLLRATEPVAAMDFCVKQADSRARRCGVELCLQQPDLWSRFDCALIGWREILEQALTHDADLLSRIPRAAEIIASLLDRWLDDSDISENILAKIGSTRFADLTDYPRRSEVFARLPLHIRRLFLEATARSWMQRFFHELPAKPVLQGQLREAAFGSILAGRRFSARWPNLARGGIQLLTTFREATEVIFDEWLQVIATSSEHLNREQVGQIVSLLKVKNWERSAFTVKQMAKRARRADLLAVWDGYWFSMTWQDKLLLRLSDTFSPNAPPMTSNHPNLSESIEKAAVFITALNLEFDAVCAHLTEITKKSIGGTIYAVGSFAHQQYRCKVVVALAGMGNAEATLATERAIQNFSPSYAFFVGIAGGLKSDLRLGDVVAADKVYAYEAGKAQREFQSRPKAPFVSYAASQMANEVVRSNRWLNRIKPSSNDQPKAFVKPIAAGEKVVDSHESEVFKLIAARFGDAYAVAMEDFGFVVAAHANSTVTFAAVRGISDFAREKSEAEKKNSQVMAAVNAAAFSFEMLAGFLELT